MTECSAYSICWSQENTDRLIQRAKAGMLMSKKDRQLTGEMLSYYRDVAYRTERAIHEMVKVLEHGARSRDTETDS